jgi:hypothetical protein
VIDVAVEIRQIAFLQLVHSAVVFEGNEAFQRAGLLTAVIP